MQFETVLAIRVSWNMAFRWTLKAFEFDYSTDYVFRYKYAAWDGLRNMAFLRWTFSESSLSYMFNWLRFLYKYATRDGPSITRTSKYGFPLKFKAF